MNEKSNEIWTLGNMEMPKKPEMGDAQLSMKVAGSRSGRWHCLFGRCPLDPCRRSGYHPCSCWGRRWCRRFTSFWVPGWLPDWLPSWLAAWLSGRLSVLLAVCLDIWPTGGSGLGATILASEPASRPLHRLSLLRQSICPSPSTQGVSQPASQTVGRAPTKFGEYLIKKKKKETTLLIKK